MQVTSVSIATGTVAKESAKMLAKHPPRRSRLRRLLGLKDKTVPSDEETLPEAVEIASTSSGMASHECVENQDDLLHDPYADVRDRLEELSARDRSRYTGSKQKEADHDLPLPLFAAYTTYLGYAVMILCGHIRDLLAKLLGHGRYLRGKTPQK